MAAGRVFEGKAVNYRKDGSDFTMWWRVIPVIGNSAQPRVLRRISARGSPLVRPPVQGRRATFAGRVGQHGGIRLRLQNDGLHCEKWHSLPGQLPASIVEESPGLRRRQRIDHRKHL